MKNFFTPHLNRKSERRGFTLIEVLIGAFILSIVCLGIYGGFSAVIKTVRAGRLKTDAMLLANEQIEIARNLPYQDVGIIGGLPVGLIPHEQTITRGGGTFKLTASIRNIDDPFDGRLGSSTKNDLSPADYKQMQIDIECLSCAEGIFIPQQVLTNIAPKNLETSTGNGGLFVKVFNSNGDPVSGARVQIARGATLVDEVSDNNGSFQLVDSPPGALAYGITITKSGYSNDGTYSPTASNPNPLIPPATVLVGQLTQVSFSIDKLSHLAVNVVDSSCNPLSGVLVSISGQKKVGQNPDVYKFDRTVASGATGLIDLTNLEWDTYKFSLATTGPRFLSGSSAFNPLLVPPDSDSKITLNTVARSPSGLLVSVLDSATGLPLSEAEVSLGGDLAITNQGFFNQSDWSGGSGQIIYSNKTMFSDTDGNLDVSSLPGEIKLRSSSGQYLGSGDLVSSIFDTESTSTVYTALRFLPADQATSTGPESIRLQLASGNDPATTTWKFLGPDGTVDTFYSVSGEIINPIHHGDRYVRYKLYLRTMDEHVTPNISDIGITYAAVCTPPGQAYFHGLEKGLKTISVSRQGYASYSSTVDISDDWQEFKVALDAN